MNKTLNVIIVGASGKMGQTLIDEIFKDTNLQLVGAIDHPDCGRIGEDAGEKLGLKTNIPISVELDAIKDADILIDFTRPLASVNYLEHCVLHNIKYVLGTTGFDERQASMIKKAAEKTAICFAPNMSVGVNLLVSLVQQAAAILEKDFDIEIIEAHHRHKVDAPSGTALRLGEAAADGAKRNLKKNAIYHREGTMPVRNISDIGFSTIRGGDIVGDHTVLFAGDGERIELTHRASSRATFAKGALRAAKFLSNHDQGLFDMADVLKIK